MAMTRRSGKNDCFIMKTIEEIVPQNHEVRKMEKCIDWSFIYPLVQNLYSDFGRPSIDPVILFKMLFINIGFGIHSMRKTCKQIETDFAYRWFLGISIEEEVPNYSTWSQNYIRRYADSGVFEEIFEYILKAAMDYGYVDLETIFGDATHQKANANKNKHTNEEVDLVKKAYDDELLKEINEERAAVGKKPFDSLKNMELIYDEETGEVIEVMDKKNIKVSTTDPESGCFHKGEKEKCFAYSHQTFCDKNGFVVGHVTVPGNVHDSVSFFEAYHLLQEKYKDQIKKMVLDAGYYTPAICREILMNGQKIYVPYKRPMTKKGYFKKYDYVYDEQLDIYICPNDKDLKYTTTNREGYREYKALEKDCAACPLKATCTASKQKVVTRHVWEKYKEEAEEIRHTLGSKEIYNERKETIERVFADCKEHHNLRYTRLRGLRKNGHQATLIFACHNLKRMARWSFNSSFIFA